MSDRKIYQYPVLNAVVLANVKVEPVSHTRTDIMNYAAKMAKTYSGV